MTAVTPMLKAAAQGPVLGPERKTSNGEMVNGELCRGLIAIERLVGVPPIAARKNASVVILQRDEALQAMKPIEPPRNDIGGVLRSPPIASRLVADAAGVA